jgi:hypothetical protein
MGWTGIYHKPADPKAYVLKDWEFENENVKSEVVYATKRGTTVYAAVKQKYKNAKPMADVFQPDADGAVTFGTVILTKTSKGEFMWKDMDESALPYYFDAPAKLIAMLSPVVGGGQAAENAKKWRENCLLDKAKTKGPKIVAGTKIKFKEALGFGKHGKADTFTKVDWESRGRKKHNVFWAHGIGHVQLNLKNYTLDKHYEIVD